MKKPIHLLEKHTLLTKTCLTYIEHLSNQAKVEKNSDKKELIKNKFDKVEILIRTLHEGLLLDPASKSLKLHGVQPYSPNKVKISIEQFEMQLNIFKDELSLHRDSRATLFLKNLSFILLTPVLGIGLIASYVSKNSFSFWKSHGELAIDSLKKISSLSEANCEQDPDILVKNQ